MSHTRHSNVRSACQWITAVLVLIVLASAVRAQEFRVLWGATSDTPEDGETWATWRDWANLVDLGGSGIQRNEAVFLYQSDFGLYPYAGLHESALDPTWMTRHRARILQNINNSIPDPTYSGLAIIDYENWGFTWNTTYNQPNPGGGYYEHDLDFKNDWRDYVDFYLPWTIAGLTPAQAEAVYRNSYDQAARTFILETIRYAKSLRPNAKWGYYLIPCRSYYDAQTPAASAAYQSFLHEELGWLYAEQDAFFPDIYSLYLTEGDEQPNAPYRDNVTTYVNYLSNNIRWALDAAQGRPVYPVIWMRYHENAGPYTGRFVNAINMQYPVSIAEQLSTNGVVIWESIGSTVQMNQYQEFVDNQLRPFLRRTHLECRADFNADNAVTIDDLLGFLSAFERGALSADVTGSPQFPAPDFAVDIDDLISFLMAFGDGC